MPVSVVIAGGGTAGHVEPALALADALRLAEPDTLITCLGTERGLETRLVPMRGYDLALIPPVPLPRPLLTSELTSVPGRLRDAVRATAGILSRVRADVLVGLGGYVATPGYLAARQAGVPIVVHEANARPGLANRIGSLLTRHVCTGQHGTRLLHGRYVGIPIRRQIAGLDRLALADTARAHFGLAPDLPVLLITGGSQGAASLNRAAFGAAAWLRAAGVQVLHVVGPKNAGAEMPQGQVPYVVLPYLDRMDLAYAAADFALCRAGAMTCAELTAVGMPAAYVPLPHGNGEQRLNAEPIEEAGGGLIIEDADLSPEWIGETLLPILLDGELVAAMGRAAASTGNRDADRDLAALVLSVGRGPRPAPPGRRARVAAQPGRRALPVSRPGRGPRSRAALGRAPWR